MFNNTLTNIEKKALLITLAHLSPNCSTSSYTHIYNKKVYKKIKIINKKTNLTIDFNINNYFKCNEILINLLNQVFEEYNYVCNNISSDTDILNSFALLTNGIIRQTKEDFSSTISISNASSNLINKLQQKSDICTLSLLIDNKISKNEKTCIVLVRHLIDNIISGFIFKDGIELLDFINGTRIISDILCLNASLYDENTYFKYYQQNN